MPAPVRLRRVATDGLSPDEIDAIRTLLFAAFGTDEDDAFREEDWQHSIGGMHFVLDVEGEIVAHASVVQRELHLGGRPLRTGYVEVVATAESHRGTGLGTVVMGDVASYVRDGFELGALATGIHRFYERLGWRTWRGPSSVRTEEGARPTPDEDGCILVLETPASPALDLDAPISCEWRPGDVW